MNFGGEDVGSIAVCGSMVYPPLIAGRDAYIPYANWDGAAGFQDVLMTGWWIQTAVG